MLRSTSLLLLLGLYCHSLHRCLTLHLSERHAISRQQIRWEGWVYMQYVLDCVCSTPVSTEAQKISYCWQTSQNKLLT